MRSRSCSDMWLQPCARVGLCRAQLCVLFKSSRAQPCDQFLTANFDRKARGGDRPLYADPPPPSLLVFGWEVPDHRKFCLN